MTGALEVRERGLREEDRTAHVHVERLLVGLGRERPDRLRERVRRVVHENVDASEPLDRGIDERRERVELAEVGRHAHRFAAHSLEVLLHLDAGLGLAARHDDLGPGGDVALGQREADATGATGDDHHPSLHVEQPVELLTIHAGTIPASVNVTAL